eukprot:c17873_g1_i1.p1 GENE.c17873_g1_i1~~c17873_g1_i1.p1  ORF type:complete len:789 (+),score=138.37 c17873_g1_i1:25-2391(+)
MSSLAAAGASVAAAAAAAGASHSSSVHSDDRYGPEAQVTREDSLTPPSDRPRASSANLPTRSGFLVKEGHVVKSWRQRWFCLESGILSYYNSQRDSNPKGRISLNEEWVVERFHEKTRAREVRGIQLKSQKPNAKVKVLRMITIDGDDDSLTQWMNDLSLTITMLRARNMSPSKAVDPVQRSPVKAPVPFSSPEEPINITAAPADEAEKLVVHEQVPDHTLMPPPSKILNFAALTKLTGIEGYTRLDDDDLATVDGGDDDSGVALEKIIEHWKQEDPTKQGLDDGGADEGDGNDENADGQSGKNNLYVCIDMTLNEINILTQRFNCGITIDFFWQNSYTFSPRCMDGTLVPAHSLHLIRYLYRVYKHIEAHGNDPDAWRECDDHILPFMKMYDPKQGEEWWKYVYRMGSGEYEGIAYIDIFLFLRTSAVSILKNDLELTNEQIPDVLHNFLKAFMHPSYEMRTFYRYTTNFSKMLHQLSDLSHNFNDLETLNRTVMSGKAVFRPDLFDNCVDQRDTAWPQMCFYPSRNLCQVIWEEGWAGTRIEGTFQEQIELQDYPMDRQLLCLKPKSQWANASPIPPPGIFEAKKKFFSFTISPDLLSYSQWRYYPAVLLEHTNEEGERSVTYAVRIERLLMPYIGSVILPLFLIVLLTMLPMLISPEDLADRCNVVLTLLLTAVALYFVVKQGLPQVPYITVMEKYVSCSIFLISLIAAESALVSVLSPRAARNLDIVTATVLFFAWLVPHALLFLLESRGMFRRPWQFVYESQLEEQSATYVSEGHEKGRRVIL